MPKTERHLFICQCHCLEHQFVVSYFDDPSDPDWGRETYLNMHLSRNRSFWQRLTTAVYYVLGRQCRFGAFDEILLSPEQCAELSTLLRQRADVKLANGEPIVWS